MVAISVSHGETCLDGQRSLRDQVCGSRPDNVHAQNSVILVRQDLHNALAPVENQGSLLLLSAMGNLPTVYRCRRPCTAPQ